MDSCGRAIHVHCRMAAPLRPSTIFTDVRVHAGKRVVLVRHRDGLLGYRVRDGLSKPM